MNQKHLKGDGVHLGFGKPLQNNGMAQQPVIVHQFGAGVASLKLGKYADAVQYLNKFNTDDAILNARKYGCLG